MRNNTLKIKRPWGSYTILKKTNKYWVKKLFIRKHARLSLQSHQFRDEVWFVLNGNILAQVGNKVYHAKKSDVIFIPKEKQHRITAITKACVLEISFGNVLERDIIRYEDDYGRITQ